MEDPRGISDPTSSAALLFCQGRFAEALALYDGVVESVSDGHIASEGGEQPRDPSSIRELSDTVCNRAAAKLHLEMFRGCLRDCDWAIKMDPHSLRAHILKGEAHRRLGNKEKAQRAFEAGVAIGTGAGDVILFAELQTRLQATREESDSAPLPAPWTPDLSAEVLEQGESGQTKPTPMHVLGRGLTPLEESSQSDHPLIYSSFLVSGQESTSVAMASDASDGIDTSSAVSPDVESTTRGAVRVSDRLPTGVVVGEIDLEAEGEGEARVVEDEVGLAEEGAEAAVKKRKKKKKKRKGKGVAGAEDGGVAREGNLSLMTGHGLPVDVQGLSQALAESSISPAMLLAARAHLNHGVGVPSIDNIIALGNLQVNTGNYRKAAEMFRSLLDVQPGLVGAYLGLGSALALLGSMEEAVEAFTSAIEVVNMHNCSAMMICTHLVTRMGALLTPKHP
ncbi:unnamed protein product [Discosporangium mesarthrocarpum]